MRSSLAVAASISDNWTDGLKIINSAVNLTGARWLVLLALNIHYSTRSESLLCPMFTTHPLGVLVKLAFAVLGVSETLVASCG